MAGHILRIDVLPTPTSVLNFIKCNCKRQCNAHQCSCRKNVMKCTSICGCDAIQCNNAKASTNLDPTWNQTMKTIDKTID